MIYRFAAGVSMQPGKTAVTGNADASMDAVPHPGKVAATLGVIEIQPDAHGPAHQVGFGYETPFAAVVAAVAVVTHHEEMALGHHPLAVSRTAAGMDQNVVLHFPQLFGIAHRIRPWRGAFHFVAAVRPLRFELHRLTVDEQL